VRDVLRLNRAYGRLQAKRGGRLDHEALLTGARNLLGDWFPEAWADDERRAHGIAFESVTLRRRFEPEQRLRHAALGPLAPPLEAPERQHWETAEPVLLPAPEAALALLRRPPRWPDMGAAAGRFSALRATGLAGQTFEVEAVSRLAAARPVFRRGYVTCTALHVRADGTGDVDRAVRDLEERYGARTGGDRLPLLPAGGEPLALVVLTTHDGDVFERGSSHLLVWQSGASAFIRHVGVRDRGSGEQDIWQPSPASRSMLAQLALVPRLV
jgi:hypothetical protein